MGFTNGNKDGKHYWLTPPDLMADLASEYSFNFDACPFPLPDNFDGLTSDWGQSTYVNPPFGSIIHEGKKKGPTAWARKSILEYEKGNDVVMVYPIDKWVLMLIKHAKYIRNLGDVKWCSIEDGRAGKGIGRHTALFYLNGRQTGLREMMKETDVTCSYIEKPCPKCGGQMAAGGNLEWCVGECQQTDKD